MPAPRTISLLVIDPSEVFRSSLETLLSAEAPDCQVVGEVSDGAEGVESVRRLKPDVILLERHLPDMSGFELLASVRCAWPEARILMTSVDWDPPTRHAAMERGAAGILPKHTAAEHLVEAVRRVAAGETYEPPGEEDVHRSR